MGIEMNDEFWSYNLTSTVDNVQIADWEVTSEELGIHSETPFRVWKKTLHGGRQEGSTLIGIDAGDLSLSVIPTRGMGLYKARFRGVDFGWASPVDEIVNPSFIRLGERGGLGWLDGFNELMVRCGYEWSGHPCLDGTTLYSLHGRAGNTPASTVTIRIEREAPHRIEIRGLLKEKTFKFSDLEIWTCLTVTPGKAGFAIRDHLANLSDYDRDYQIIYHTNYGRPLLGEGARFLAPVKRVAPFNERAKEGLKTWETYLGPTRGFDEEVFVCELYSEASSKTVAALINATGDLGMAMRHDVRELPAFTLWKNTDTDRQGYVTGLEPGTNYPYPKVVERNHGRLRLLEAGGSREFGIEFQPLTSATEVEAISSEIRCIVDGRDTVHEVDPVFLLGN